MAIDLGEKEKNDIQRVFNYLLFHFCSIYMLQIYNLQRGKEDFKNRLKSAAEIRKSIDDAYKVFLDTKKSVQEMCSEEVKESIDKDVNSILERTVVNNHIDDILKEIEAFNNSLMKYMTVLGELEDFPAIGKKKLRELLHPPNPVTDQEKVMMTLELMDDVGMEFDKWNDHNKLWLDKLAPSKTSPESEMIVQRMTDVRNSLLAIKKVLKNKKNPPP